MRPITPNSEDVIRAWIEKYLQDDVHTSFPGRIQSYDAAKQTADIQPLIRHAVKQADDSYEYEELPVLPSVPVIFPRVGEWFLGFRISEGDTILVVCCESAIGHWRVGDGAIQYPGDTRRHHLSHAVAIPGLFVRDRALVHAPPFADDFEEATVPALVLGRDRDGDDIDAGTRVTIRKNGALEISQGTNTRIEISASGAISLTSASNQPINVMSDGEVTVQGSAIKLKSA